MEKEEVYEFLGCGWSFPPTFSKTIKGVEMTELEENVSKSVRILVLTRLGERRFHPDMGTDINAYAFIRNVDSMEIIQLKRMIRNAITENESRVDVDDVDVRNNQDEDCLEISIAYTIKAFNTKYNMVFPFYFENGIEI